MDRGHPGARLRVGAVGRQLVVLAERLVGVPRAHAAGQVRAAGDRPLPLALDRPQQLGVAGLDRDVDRAARQVEGPHGVAAERLGLADRHVVLEVRRGRARCRPAPAARGARRTAAPAPGSAPRRSPGTARPAPSRSPDARIPRLAGPNASQTWSAARRDTSMKRSSPTRAQARDRGLDQVAVAVELVAPLEVGVAVRAPSMAEAGVEVAVLLLRVGHLRAAMSIERRARRRRTTDLPRHRLDAACRRRSRRTRARARRAGRGSCRSSPARDSHSWQCGMIVSALSCCRAPQKPPWSSTTSIGRSAPLLGATGLATECS